MQEIEWKSLRYKMGEKRNTKATGKDNISRKERRNEREAQNSVFQPCVEISCYFKGILNFSYKIVRNKANIVLHIFLRLWNTLDIKFEFQDSGP